MESPLYALHAPPLRWRTWDDSVLVHHDASGSTHFLDAVSAAVLRHLESGSQGPAGLAERLAGELELPGGSELEMRVACVLEEFERLGLAERVR